MKTKFLRSIFWILKQRRPLIMKINKRLRQESDLKESENGNYQCCDKFTVSPNKHGNSVTVFTCKIN